MERSNLLRRWCLAALVGAVAIATAAALPALGGETGSPAGSPKTIANPIEQRAEMIALLRSIDARLQAIEKNLEETPR